MKLLLVKTSSLGDVVHTFPALTDAAAALPGLSCDWVVEEAFAELPGWHPAVETVIPVALRRWRRDWLRPRHRQEIRAFLGQLRARRYDCVIDAQGLIKSGLLATLAHGPRAGFDHRSAREPWVSWSYRRRHRVARTLHAVERLRRLFAAELGYGMPTGAPDYGIRRRGRPVDPDRPYLVLLHGTTWPSKAWPAPFWAELTHTAAQAGLRVHLPWYAPEERLQAELIISAAGCGELLPREGLTALAARLTGAAGVVGVDTGLAHLTAALAVPAVTLYGPTRVALTGAVGPNQLNLQADFPCAPCMRRHCEFQDESPVQPACFATLPPNRVWQALQRQMEAR